MSATTLGLQANGIVTMLLNQMAVTHDHETASTSGDTTGGDIWSDEALLDAIVKRGSQHHFGTLLARYKLKIYHIALSVLGPSQQAQAEDVTQEIFIKLYHRLESFRGDCRFSTWLYRMAVNTSIDYQRKNKKFDAVDIHQIAEQAAEGTAESNVETMDMSVHVKQSIETLTQSQRMMVYLVYWLGLKVREVAEVMDCPEGTVKVYLARAKKLLAIQLEDYINE